MLIKREKPTEIAFYLWIRNFPESFHPLDMKRFYQFVKTACRYRNRKMLNHIFLKKKILKEKPDFSPENLEYFLSLIECCRTFYNSHALPTIWHSEDEEEEKKHPNSFRLDTIKQGRFFSEYKSMSKW